jgi:hypothetical protein
MAPLRHRIRYTYQRLAARFRAVSSRGEGFVIDLIVTAGRRTFCRDAETGERIDAVHLTRTK